MISYSHPEVPLDVHLRNVAIRCRNQVQEMVLPEKFKAILADLAYLCGAFHDLGKATTYFQYYLSVRGIGDNFGPKHHALISALFVKEITKVYLSQSALSQAEKELLSMFCFTCVKRHHGSLLDLGEEIIFDSQKKVDLLAQIKAFLEDDVEEIMQSHLVPYNIIYSFTEFKEKIYTGQYEEDYDAFWYETMQFGEFSKFPIALQIQFHFYHQILYSALLLADKSDVILKTDHSNPSSTVKFPLLAKYRQEKGYNSPQTSLHEHQNEAYFETLEKLSSTFSADHTIYSLTLPTGMGKTITSFGAALQLKTILHDNGKKIIITIPYTSIIDQNYQVYEDILKSESSEVLLKHHHLSEPVYKMQDQDLGPDKSSFLIETWQSETVVTTFVQLLNSLYSNDKSLAMKLNALSGAIIILDEVQSIPYKYWELLRETLQVVGKTYGCYFILMSATQPLLFTEKEQIRELVPNYKKYFNLFNRTALINRIEPAISTDVFHQIILEYLLENPFKDVLIIQNTKKAARELMEFLDGSLDETEQVFFLTTLITPYERKKIIHEIKNGNGKRKVVVSTQLIEAGVDISMDTVFRCLAPLDSIIQAAGRANRYGEKNNIGEVYLYEVFDNHISSRIYGAELLQKTRNILKGINTISEENYLTLIEKYYQQVSQEARSIPSKYLDCFALLQFQQLGKFALIEEEFKTESIYLQLNAEAKELWERYMQIFESNADLHFKRQQFSTIKSRFYDFVINVPLGWKKETIDFDSEKTMGFYVSLLTSPSLFYSYSTTNYRKNTGYKIHHSFSL
jgi:CRISPR-associated endonuclease/helicase Cas3